MTFSLISIVVIALGGGVVDWSVPEGCPSEDFLLEELNEHLSRPLDPNSNDVHIRGTVRPVAGTLRLDARIRVGTRERRELEFGADCWEIVAQLALLLAIDIEPLGWREQSQAWSREQDLKSLQPDAPLPVKPAPPAVDPPRVDRPRVDLKPSAKSPSDEAPRTVGGVLAVAGGTMVNLFPNAAGGADIRGGIQVGWARILTLAHYWGGARYLSSDRTRGADLLAWDLGLEACGAPYERTFETRLCIAAAAGSVRARGFGALVNPRPVQRPWIWTSLRTQFGWRINTMFGLFASIGANISLLRPTFVVENPDLTYTTPSVAASAIGGVEVHLTAKSQGSRKNE